MPCISLADLFSCFNGGECVHPAFCDCRRFNATGPRCQMGESGLHSTSGRGHRFKKICGPETQGSGLEGVDREPTSLGLSVHCCYTEMPFLSLAQCTMPALRETASAGRGDSITWRRLMASTTTCLGRAATLWWGAMNLRGRSSQSR